MKKKILLLAISYGMAVLCFAGFNPTYANYEEIKAGCEEQHPNNPKAVQDCITEASSNFF